MTILESSITFDLRSVADFLESSKSVVEAVDFDPAIKTLENAISKIQHLRCEAIAQLDKL